jgi:mannose-6-phosphate isomerase-like protein (cupin superfamily)
MMSASLGSGNSEAFYEYRLIYCSRDSSSSAVCCLLSAVCCLLTASTTMNKINLNQKLSLINDHWNPRIIGELNGQYLKLVKFEGPFTWHHHESEDEMFLVVKGRFRMEFRKSVDSAENGRDEIWLEEGEFCIVPRGVEHRPVADEEAHVLLFEPATTLNTGNVENELTRQKLGWL